MLNVLYTIAQSGGSNSELTPTWMTPLVLVVMLLFSLTLTLWLGKYIWNNVLIELVAIINPVKSVWQILALMVLFHILLPTSTYIIPNQVVKPVISQ